jgi:hypothetical protein
MTATFAEIVKNAREVTCVTAGDFRGENYAHVRVHVRTADGLKPTSKGVAMRADQLADVIAGLEAARTALGGD